MKTGDDYLWDRTGSDPEIERLEKLLAGARMAPRPAPDFEAPPVRPRPRARRVAIGFAIAALALVAVWVPYGIVVDRGAPTLAVTVGARRFLVHAGEAIHVENEPARVDLRAVGHLVAAPGSELRVLEIAAERERLRLERGTIAARIGYDVRPRLFQVETPATTCVDLGCVYTLSVDARGGALVHVDVGRVAFEDGGREVYVPAGASCRAAKGRGSGTPLFDDASLPLTAAVFGFDQASADRRETAARLVARLASRPRDSLVLWHLLADGAPPVRAIALDALERLRKDPAGAAREATLARDPKALAVWRDALEGDWR